MDFACCVAYIIYVIYTGWLAAVLDLACTFFFVINNFEIRFWKVIIVAIIAIITTVIVHLCTYITVRFCLPKPVTKKRCQTFGFYVSQKQRLPIYGTVKMYTVAVSTRTVLTFTTWVAVWVYKYGCWY